MSPVDENLPADDPTFDHVVNLKGQPMLLIIGDEIHAWDEDLGDYTRMPYDLEDGKVVARSDNS